MEHSVRIRVVSVGFVVLWLLLVGRAFEIQLLQHDRWQLRAEDSQGALRPIPAVRGEILSADGTVLARSVPNRSLGVDPKMVKDPWSLALALDSLGVVDPVSFVRTIEANRDKRFVWLSRSLLPEARLEVLLHRFPSLSPQPESKRLYPLGWAASSIVGLVGRDDNGLGGLEADYADVLRGRPGRAVYLLDASPEPKHLDTKILAEPVAGMSLVLSVVAPIQEIAAARLRAVVKREHAHGGFVIVIRPETGEILALATEPSADPLDPSTWTPEALRLRAVTDAFEPGSSYKVVAFAAALDAGLIDRNTLIDCMGGRRHAPGGGVIKDHESYGVLAAIDVLAQSSNIGTGLIAERAGVERFIRMERAFGFGLPTGVQLPGEGRGRIPEPSDTTWSARSLITQAFGQEISVTGIQLAMAYAAIANDGKLMRPLLLREMRRPDGSVAERWEPEMVRQVMSPETAAELRGMLRAVVTDGTAKKAEIDGWPVAGKTSTAQKYIPEEKGYSSRHYFAGFVGMAPFDDPEAVCIVVIDEPTSEIYGGSIAAPVFREVMAGVRPILDGSGSGPVMSARALTPARAAGAAESEVPSVLRLSASLARDLLADRGFEARMTGDGAWVSAAHPPAGTKLPPGSVITLELAVPPAGEVAALPPMPDLLGLSLRDAFQRMRSLGVATRVLGSGWVLEQTPAPGEVLLAGVECRIVLGPDSCRALKEWIEGGEGEHREFARSGFDARASR